MDDPRYPIGPFSPAGRPLSDDERAAHIEHIRAHPARMREAVRGLDDEQLDTPYRDGGWTVRQVVHHVVDSHLNAYMRFKLAATEDHPTIRTYEESRWAELPEAKSAPVELSLTLLEALHARWVAFLDVHGADRLRAHAPLSRHRGRHGRPAAGAVLVARPPSHRARHPPERSEGMVAGVASPLVDELRRRSLLHDATEGAAEHLAEAPRTAYVGFDPTGSSLHIGSLVPIMGLVHAQRAGHTPIALVGGGTGLIGDPSGKTQERQLLTKEKAAENAESIRGQLEHFLDFGAKSNPARMREQPRLARGAYPSWTSSGTSASTSRSPRCWPRSP